MTLWIPEMSWLVQDFVCVYLFWTWAISTETKLSTKKLTADDRQNPRMRPQRSRKGFHPSPDRSFPETEIVSHRQKFIIPERFGDGNRLTPGRRHRIDVADRAPMEIAMTRSDPRGCNCTNISRTEKCRLHSPDAPHVDLHQPQSPHVTGVPGKKLNEANPI